MDPELRGIAAILAMCPDPLPEIGQQDHKKSALQIYEKLDQSTYRLVDAPGSSRLILQSIDSVDSKATGEQPCILKNLPWLGTINQVTKDAFEMLWKLTERFWLRIREHINGRSEWMISLSMLRNLAGRIRRFIVWYVEDQPAGFIFRPEVFGLWLLSLGIWMGFTGHIANSLNQNGNLSIWNYRVPLSPHIYFVVGIFMLVGHVFPGQHPGMLTYRLVYC